MKKQSAGEAVEKGERRALLVGMQAGAAVTDLEGFPTWGELTVIVFRWFYLRGASQGDREFAPKALSP